MSSRADWEYWESQSWQEDGGWQDGGANDGGWPDGGTDDLAIFHPSSCHPSSFTVSSFTLHPSCLSSTFIIQHLHPRPLQSSLTISSFLCSSPPAGLCKAEQKRLKDLKWQRRTLSDFAEDAWYVDWWLHGFPIQDIAGHIAFKARKSDHPSFDQALTWCPFCVVSFDQVPVHKA